MKKIFGLCAVFAICLAAVMLVSCGKEKPVLHIYNWGDYMSSDVVRMFEKKYDCNVKIDVFDSNEAMYAKLMAGAGGYDIVVPSSYTAKLMYAQKMIQELDLSKLPNVTEHFDNIFTNLLLDSKMVYSVPYFASFTGIGYKPDRVKDFKPSWRMFEDESLHKRCCLLNDQREVIGCAMKTLGKSVNCIEPEAVAEAVALVKEWKKNIAKFEVDDAKRALASGEFILIQNYNGDMLQVIAENPNIKFVIPEEGSTVTFDNFAITSTSKNVDLAHEFINFIYDPEICAMNMNEVMYLTPNLEAVKLVNEELRNNPAFSISPEDMKRCDPLDDLGENIGVINRAWEEILQD